MSENHEIRKFECRVRSRGNPQDIEVIHIEAADKEEAVSRLQRDGNLVVSVREPNASNRAVKHSIQKILFESKRQTGGSLFNSVTTRELIFFAVQLSTLLKAGIALVRALEILQKGTANPYFSSAIKQMAQFVSEGHSLAEAIKKYPKIFPWLWMTLVDVGEMSGTLPDVLEEVGQYQEASERVKSKVISALFYPAVLFFIAGGAVLFLMMVIIPKFKAIFESQHLTLPVITQIVLTISLILKNYFLIVAGLVIMSIFIFRAYAKSPLGKVATARSMLKMPVFGNMLMQVSVVRFCRGLSTLLKAGIPLLKGLETASVLTGNAYIQKQVDQARESVSQGHGLGVQLEIRKAFPVFMTQLVSVGEETGEIAPFLKLLADYYEEQVSQLLARLSTLIEPIMLVFMAVIIGGIVISIFLPIVQLSTGGS